MKKPKVTATSIQSAKPPSGVLRAGNDAPRAGTQLVIITGMSGSGKGTVMKAFEDLGFFCVDNLPVDLIPTFAELCDRSRGIPRAALVVDIREGQALSRLPAIYKKLRQEVQATLVFLEADEETLVRRYSETRRPHPMSPEHPVRQAIRQERKMLQPIRAVADLTLETSRFNVHELRATITERFKGATEEARTMLIACVSFGYRHGVPPDSDLVFDVRFLPNPNYLPQFRNLTGRHPKVAKYIKSFPQTKEFITRITDLLIYLVPHYIREGKSYLTISFGCTGGQHRSVTLAETIQKRLAEAGYRTKVVHRDSA